MCLILFAYKSRPGSRLILAANRDEFYSRPTAPMHFWPESPWILAGRDLQAKGTWLGISKTGKFAALTNYRDPLSIMTTAPSRGRIIQRYLESDDGPRQYLESLQKSAGRFNGFNLIAADKHELYWYSNRSETITKLKPGFYGLSNHLINTPWPKIQTGTRLLTNACNKKTPEPEDLFNILQNRNQPRDTELPDTGVGKEWEKILAPIFIKSLTYGTRSSTVVRMDTTGLIRVSERTFHQTETNHHDEKSYTFLSD